MKICIVIPSYNEEKKILSVIKDLKRNGYNDIIVVDDGSKDSTLKILKNQNAAVLKHIINRGQGAALKTGIDYALKQNADIIITFDADGQHQAKNIKRLIEPLLKNEADIALGSRFINKQNKIPLLKKIVLKGGIIFTFLFSGIWLTDTHNGLRAISKKAAEKIEIKHDGMEHASEIIDEIARKRLKYKEVPVSIKYTKYSKNKGQSVLNSFKIAFKLIIRRIMG